MPLSSCSLRPLGIATEYGLFVIGDLSGLQACNNHVAVGGNAQFYSDFDDIEGDLIVGGSLSAGSGDIDGKLIVGNLNNAVDFEVRNGVQFGNPIDFNKEKIHFQYLSNAYGRYVTTGTTHSLTGIVTFSGEHPRLNVFSINAALLSSASYIKILAPNNSTVLINVVGSSVTINSDVTMAVIGVSTRNVLWNMPSTTSIKISVSTFRGSILSPNASVEYKYGWMKGSIIANNMIGTDTQFEYKFSGCLPTVS
jgi:choice-of-anchor A domain-containing protein